MLSIAFAQEAEIRRGIRWITDKITGKITKEKTTLTDDVVQNMVTTIPFVSQGVSMAVYKSDPVPFTSSIRDIAEGVGTGIKTTKDMIQGKEITDKSKVAVDTLAGIGSAFGVPGTAQAKKLLKSEIDSDSKSNIISLYEQALRTDDDKKVNELIKQANELAGKTKILREDAMDAAETRVHKEIIDLYEDGIRRSNKDAIAKGDALGKTAGFDAKTMQNLEKSAERRINKEGKKESAIGAQTEEYEKSHPSLVNRVKGMIESLK
jgi:hypothetical protein